MKTIAKTQGMFLVCDGCGYCCYLRGPQARGVAADPPACPGCAAPTRVARREPWRDDLRATAGGGR